MYALIDGEINKKQTCSCSNTVKTASEGLGDGCKACTRSCYRRVGPSDIAHTSRICINKLRTRTINPHKFCFSASGVQVRSNFASKSYRGGFTFGACSPWLRARRISIVLWSHSCGQTGRGWTRRRYESSLECPNTNLNIIYVCSSASWSSAWWRLTWWRWGGPVWRRIACIPSLRPGSCPCYVGSNFVGLCISNSVGRRVQQARDGDAYHRWKSLSVRSGRWNWHQSHCYQRMAGCDSAHYHLRT